MSGIAGARGRSLTAHAGIGLEKFQTSFTLLGANLFYGIIILERCLLLLELPEVSDLNNRASLSDILSEAEGELNQMEWLSRVVSLRLDASCFEAVDFYDECTEGEDPDLLLLVSFSVS